VDTVSEARLERYCRLSVIYDSLSLWTVYSKSEGRSRKELGKRFRAGTVPSCLLCREL